MKQEITEPQVLCLTQLFLNQTDALIYVHLLLQASNMPGRRKLQQYFIILSSSIPQT